MAKKTTSRADVLGKRDKDLKQFFSLDPATASSNKSKKRKVAAASSASSKVAQSSNTTTAASSKLPKVDRPVRDDPKEVSRQSSSQSSFLKSSKDNATSSSSIDWSGMSNQEASTLITDLIDKKFKLKDNRGFYSLKVNVNNVDGRVLAYIIMTCPDTTSPSTLTKKIYALMSKVGFGKHGDCLCVTRRASMHEKITNACKEVNVQSTTNTNDGDGVFENTHAPHTDDSPDVNSPTPPQNTNNVDATDVDATDVDAEPNDTFYPEDIAMGDSGSPRTSDSPVLLSEQVGETTNASIVDNGGADGQKLSQLLDMMSKMKQQLDNVQAENDSLKQRLTAVESSNSLLQQRCSIMERQYSRLMMHHLVTGDRASTVTPPSKHIIKPQLITFGNGKILSTVGIDAVDRRLISGTKRRLS